MPKFEFYVHTNTINSEITRTVDVPDEELPDDSMERTDQLIDIAHEVLADSYEIGWREVE
jgi:hypothetical protein